MKACSPGRLDPLVNGSRRGKVRQACDTCAQRKLSCDSISPCTRCLSSGASCTYQRRTYGVSRPAPSTDTSTGDLPPSEPHVVVGTPSTSSREDVPFPFLLAFTSPAEHESTTILVTASKTQATSNGQAISAPLEPSALDFSFEYYGALFWDHENWASEFIDHSIPSFNGNVDQHSHSFTQKQVDTILETRLAQMCSQLGSTHAHILASNPYSRVSFDKSLAEQVFTTANLETFIQAHFQHLHQYYPIIHRPTFSPETVSLPLLVAIFLLGALAAPPTDSALSARRFYDIAEEYIFEHLAKQSSYNEHAEHVQSGYDFEVLQAAHMINIVQNGTNNVITRRRLRMKRHPSYIAALRSHGLFEHASEGSADTLDTVESKWHSFISKESRKRYEYHSEVYITNPDVEFK